MSKLLKRSQQAKSTDDNSHNENVKKLRETIKKRKQSNDNVENSLLTSAPASMSNVFKFIDDRNTAAKNFVSKLKNKDSIENKQSSMFGEIDEILDRTKNL